MIKISVIIPNYNHAPFLEERIDSVLAQTYPAAEIILLDDASSDASQLIIEKYRANPLVTHIEINKQNSGSPFKQWDKGIHLAKHDWVWIAESDDYCSPDFLKTAALNIRSNSNPGLFFCNSQVKTQGENEASTADVSNNLLKTEFWNSSYSDTGINEINRALKFHSVVLNASAVIFNKKNLVASNSQLKCFRYYGDWYAYIKILEDSGIVYNADIHNFFRRTEKSHSRKMKVKDRLYIKTDSFRILHLLLNIPAVKDKKKLTTWFIRNYVGFGIIADGPWFIIRLAIIYYSINFKLATKILLKTVSVKFLK
jgi:glycosyltransferase involved in cell wall biosynthesis